MLNHLKHLLLLTAALVPFPLFAQCTKDTDCRDPRICEREACVYSSERSNAQAPEVVNAPYFEVGDCWTYSAKGIFRHGWVESYRECVTYINREKNVVLAVATVQPGGEEYETSYTLDWGPSTTLDGSLRSPPAELLRFPLHVGDSWQAEWTYQQTFISTVRGHTALTTNVIGWEDVSVPAGKFRALKVRAIKLSGPLTGYARPYEFVCWYVPSVNRIVKSIDATAYGNQETELMKVELKP